MNSMQVKCVIALGKTKNYTKAAESLFVSQSTVSKNISRLEDELGFKIVTMQGRQVAFTKDGEYFYQQLCQIHQQFEETISNIYSQEKERPIIIRHSTAIFERYYLPRFLQLFRQKSQREIVFSGFRPNISFQDNLDLFYENQADFILIQQDFFHHDERLGFTPLLTGKFSVIINRKNPLAKKKTISLSDLANERVWIWNSSPAVPSVLKIEQALKQIMPVDQIRESDGIISCEMYATANEGIGIVPSFAYDNNLNPDVVYNFLDLDVSLVYGAFYLKTTEKASYFNDVIDNLKEAVALERKKWH